MQWKASVRRLERWLSSIFLIALFLKRTPKITGAHFLIGTSLTGCRRFGIRFLPSGNPYGIILTTPRSDPSKALKGRREHNPIRSVRRQPDTKFHAETAKHIEVRIESQRSEARTLALFV